MGLARQTTGLPLCGGYRRTMRCVLQTYIDGLIVLGAAVLNLWRWASMGMYKPCQLYHYSTPTTLLYLCKQLAENTC